MSRRGVQNWQTFDGPGMCQERKCSVHGPRCVDGFCSVCCADAHKDKHSPPPKAGEFKPFAKVIYRREFKV